ncbi:MAG: hypothetical protein IPI10_17385 [Bacteroidetes bacterium]|nr:hypothetical protein [Bacteroidota bacterium]
MFPWNGITGFVFLVETELGQILTLLDEVQNQIPEVSRQIESPISADSPIPFEINNLPDYLSQLAENESGRDFSQFVSMLGLRLRNLFQDIRLKSVLSADSEISLEQWLNDYVASSDNSRQITILDLSLIPSDIIHIIIAVFARMTFESLQRYRRINGQELPTVLIMEEAHTFVHESRNLDSNYSQICFANIRTDCKRR